MTRPKSQAAATVESLAATAPTFAADWSNGMPETEIYYEVWEYTPAGERCIEARTIRAKGVARMIANDYQAEEIQNAGWELREPYKSYRVVEVTLSRKVL